MTVAYDASQALFPLKVVYNTACTHVFFFIFQIKIIKAFILNNIYTLINMFKTIYFKKLLNKN